MEQPAGTVSFADLTIEQFVERLVLGRARPRRRCGGGCGGGSRGIAGFDGAGLSTGKPKYEAYEATLAKCESLGHELTAEFLRLADRDAEAYAGYSTALKMPRETEDQQKARKQAIQLQRPVPPPKRRWTASRPAASLAIAAEALAGRSNVNAASDVLVAALLGEAAARSAAENVLINLPSTGDEQYSEKMRWQVDAVLHDIAAVAARTREIVLSGQSQDPEPA
jgi:formiminotetrahydrofolate cyclodeaminase